MVKLNRTYLANKNNKNGFTLIELIAIILVLAILIMIAIPFITKIDEEASKEAFKQTTKGTASALEKNCDLDILNNEKIVDKYVIENYNITIGEKINVKGRLPLYAYANVNNKCNVQIAAHNKKWCATKAYDEDKVTVTKYVEGQCKVGDTGPTLVTGNDTWDGWITMTLYYPAGSTDREWRLGSQGEVRYDDTLMWQPYTGSITVRLDRVEDVWIRYNLDGKTVTIPPAGTLLVDIEPDSYGTNKKVSSVKVKITYDEDATVKEYRVGDSDWMTYTGEFTVTENVIIEARASKPDNIYDADGNLILSRKITGRDVVYIGNININETVLPAPTIKRLSAASGDEVAKVKITYPAGSDKKIYKENYGIEKNYTDEISIKKYGTYIIAYYYDASGKRSQASSIYINDPNAGGGPGTPEPPTGYDPDPPLPPENPQPPVTPSYRVVAPTITGNPDTPTNSPVEITVTPPVTADAIYIKKDNGNYALYTGPITVKTNTLITAYYVTNNGEKSEKGYYLVKNIVEGNKPYLAINADPYPYFDSYGKTSVNVSLEYNNADTVEYSENGIEYQAYVGAFTVTENKTIYARATNLNGTTLRQLSITNIGGSGPTKPDILSVNIMVAPEPVTATNLVAKVTVKIDYDSKATKKYYTLGIDGLLTEYTGEFEVVENTTIYAYAISSNGKGSDSKMIDNLLNGISEPNIIADPSNSIVASSTLVSIEYDKNATVKRYSINGGTLRDYTAPIEIEENSTVYAYNSNVKGDEADSTYYINNINPKTSIFLIDKGYYYILKLSYPELSAGREYKWTKDGIWKSYDEKGILLIKPEYKDELLDVDNNFKIGIEDDNGDIVDFTNHWYIIETDFKSLKENIFMRWDTTTPPTPEIVLNTLEPAKTVTATIVYNKVLIKKEYKITDNDGNLIQDWTDYNGGINITKNNTIIYARGMDESEVWSKTAIYKVKNIDENPPIIKLTTDLEKVTQKLGIRVSATDDVLVSKVKWAKGVLGESYFASGGTEILNNSIVNITENAYYTFYAEDGVGNKQVYTINVENIDLTPPLINIVATPEDTVGTTTHVTIDFGDSTTKQYKIGNGTTWSTYSAAFDLTSYTVLTNNWQNANGTVTIYAKGKDSIGNEITVQKTLVNLDLDKPSAPVIVSNASYPVLTSTGVILDSTTSIAYDTRTDITNYYSIDNGATWNLYTGSFNYSSGTVLAKSIKKGTGLEVSASKIVAMPSDAIGSQAYDKSTSTGFAAKLGEASFHYMIIDESVLGKVVKLTAKGYAGAAYNINFYNENKAFISNISGRQTTLSTYTATIPANAKYIGFSGGGSKKDDDFSVAALLIEVYMDTSPTYAGTFVYPIIKASGVVAPYNLVKINHYITSDQKLYSLDGGTTWQTYNNEELKVPVNTTLKAKGIDKDGNESFISTYTSSAPADVIGIYAYDGSTSTGFAAKLGESVFHYIEIDSSAIGKNINIYAKGYAGAAYNINFYDQNKVFISNISGRKTTTTTYTKLIPPNAKYIGLSGGGYKTDNDFSYSALIIEMYF